MTQDYIFILDLSTQCAIILLNKPLKEYCKTETRNEVYLIEIKVLSLFKLNLPNFRLLSSYLQIGFISKENVTRIPKKLKFGTKDALITEIDRYV